MLRPCLTNGVDFEAPTLATPPSAIISWKMNRMFTDFSTFLSRQSSANSMRDQLKSVLASSLSYQAYTYKRPVSNDVLILDDKRSVEEDLCLVIDERGTTLTHLASPSPRHSHAVAESTSVSDGAIRLVSQMLSDCGHEQVSWS